MKKNKKLSPAEEAAMRRFAKELAEDHRREMINKVRDVTEAYGVLSLTDWCDVSAAAFLAMLPAKHISEQDAIAFASRCYGAYIRVITGYYSLQAKLDKIK